MSETVLPSELPPISSELSERIAAHFCIEIYGIVHGHTSEQLAEMFPGQDPSLFPDTTTDQQRLVTRTLADTLSPNDILFREGYGHGGEQADPQLTQSIAAATPEVRKTAKDQLTQDQQAFNAISFGTIHALFNGVPVFDADASPEQKAAHQAAGSEFSPAVSRERCVAALSIVLARAIDSLPPEETPVPNPEQRRRLMVWFGGAHIDDFQRIITEAELPITTYTTEETQRIAIALITATYLMGSVRSLTGYLGANE